MALIGLHLKFIFTSYDITLPLRTFGILEYFRSSIFRLDCSVVLMAVKIKWPIYQAPEPLSHTCTKFLLLYFSATVSTLAYLAPPLGDLEECVTPAPHMCTGKAVSCPFKRRNSAYFHLFFFLPLSFPPFPSPSSFHFPNTTPLVYSICMVCLSLTFCGTPWTCWGPSHAVLYHWYRMIQQTLLDTPPPSSLAVWGVLGPWSLHQPLSLF